MIVKGKACPDFVYMFLHRARTVKDDLCLIVHLRMEGWRTVKRCSLYVHIRCVPIHVQHWMLEITYSSIAYLHVVCMLRPLSESFHTVFILLCVSPTFDIAREYIVQYTVGLLYLQCVLFNIVSFSGYLCFPSSPPTSTQMLSFEEFLSNFQVFKNV